eukprot:scaffold31158_cov49-Phaeocystis_antarctica.AAC.3
MRVRNRTEVDSERQRQQFVAPPGVRGPHEKIRDEKIRDEKIRDETSTRQRSAAGRTFEAGVCRDVEVAYDGDARHRRLRSRKGT